MLLRMASLCAASEQSSGDIRGKVLKAGLSGEDADAILEYLTANKYVDDSRFARAFAADKVRFAGWGRTKIRMHLRAKGIREVITEEAIAAVSDEDYLPALRKALAAKARTADPFDVKGRASLYRHLASRGFEPSLIVSEIKAYCAAHREEAMAAKSPQTDNDKRTG